MNVLITGGAGYIGTALIKRISDDIKFETYIIFDLKKGDDIRDKEKIDKVFQNYRIDLVIHLASFIDVEEGEKKPRLYYQNNVIGTKNLIESMEEHGVDKIVFASSASVYGNYEGKCYETNDIIPASVYGTNKMDCEELIKDSELDYVILRFFNVAGGKQKGKSLIATIKNKKSIVINGNNYNTKDGTCVRDYVHVDDIAEGIAKSALYLQKDNKSEIINLGSSKGYSVLEVVKKAKKKYVIGDGRDGDIGFSICSNKKAKKILRWSPKKNLKDMLK